MVNFINQFINGKYKNKLIILDNASSHRNQLVKDVIKKNNNLLYAVPYQHYTNAIEGYFNVLKSRLQKKKGLTYNELVNNVKGLTKQPIVKIYSYSNIYTTTSIYINKFLVGVLNSYSCKRSKSVFRTPTGCPSKGNLITRRTRSLMYIYFHPISYFRFLISKHITFVGSIPIPGNFFTES